MLVGLLVFLDFGVYVSDLLLLGLVLIVVFVCVF